MKKRTGGLSFSVAELLLAKTLTNEQRRVYSIVKFLIKYQCASDAVNGIKSYQLKTIFFWYCEEIKPSSQSLEASVRRLLDYIIEFYEHKYIPHYFIPSFNLIFDKAKDELQLFCRVLSELSKNLTGILLSFIENTYDFLFVMDEDVIDLYLTDHLRLSLFFKYNFYVFVIYGLFDDEQITRARVRNEKSIFFLNRNSPRTPTNIGYRHFLSLVTTTIHASVNIVDVLNLVADEIKSDFSILSVSEISGIICSILRCSYQPKSSTSSNYYICIC